MGIMIGEVTSKSALAQVRLTRADRLVDNDVAGSPGVVQFILDSGRDKRVYKPIKVTADRDFIARVELKGLQPGREYTGQVAHW